MIGKDFETKCILVRNIPFKMNSSDVIREFSSVGKISKIIFSNSHDSDFHRGICKITYSSTEEAKAAISKFNGRCFLGHELFVIKCHERNPSKISKLRKQSRYPIQREDLSPNGLLSGKQFEKSPMIIDGFQITFPPK